jgi:uncharacterized OB-fold protein
MIKCEKIVKKFFDALDEGKILGRKCTKCGHVEFPPYLACNTCGNLDTEWHEMSGKAVVTMMLPGNSAFADPVFTQKVGPHCAIVVKPEESDEVDSLLIGISPERVDELTRKIPFSVRPKIIQEDGWNMVFWEPAE